ncbi:MAG: hypothetical protein IPL01_24290 [Acidobacteria bacterium]|nr:hypothetical protein [Acidobacteriota bacterium]
MEQLQTLIAQTKNQEKLKADFERATREEKLIKESLGKAKLEAMSRISRPSNSICSTGRGHQQVALQRLSAEDESGKPSETRSE